ncbi:MAG: putative hydroxymethylpyrimidine transporter CytX [Lachnospiraceae bacterium]|nr:putative hydroxymethylpyrimidine transporter CytX [Lachnospiraceae bacterium]MDD6192676.1 putative hydroxymethylpyrimidine transporter CytX [Lachnospiraceae bacterium]
MNEKRTSVFSNGLIWFGAGVSIAEILTGTYFAPLGFSKALAAILLGHLIGGLMMFAAGMIGAKERKSAMETVKMSFGEKGSLLFAVLNVLQLVGWTAIMIYDGALAADGILHTGRWVWALVIGVLIVVWILVGLTNLGKLNTVAMTALFVLSLVLFKVIFFGAGSAAPIVDDGSLTFGAAVELAVAMPLSWLPLISDYTREAEKPFAATLTSVLVYSVVSIFMYVIGMGAAIFTGEYDIAQIMLKAGFGVIGLLIIVFSTVTTTFLDAYSAGVSAVSISDKIQEKWAAIIVTVIGTVAAIVYPMDNITNFLYLIGSVFAPMIAVQIADYFVLKKADAQKQGFQWRNLLVWVVGFVIYRLLMQVNTPVGNTLPDMIITVILCLIVEKIAGAMKKN